MDRRLEHKREAPAQSRAGQYYKAIDVFRLVCALLVILIHMGMGNSKAIIPCLTRQAVPFFFLVSGFFFEKSFQKAEEPLKFTWKYALSIAIVYAVWMLLWLPSTVHDALSAHPGRPWIFLAFILLRRIFLAGIAPYWYLLVLFEGSLILALILRFRWHRLGWLLCIVGLLLNVLYGLDLSAGIGAFVHRTFYMVFSWDCNVIMTGFPMLFLGMTASRHESLLRRWKPWIIALLYGAALIAAFALYPLDSSLFGIPFGITEAVLLFSFCLISPRLFARIPERFCHFARNLSSVIFLTHTFFLTVLGQLLKIWDAVPRLALTVLCCTVLYFIVAKIRVQPLHKLFMIKVMPK